LALSAAVMLKGMCCLASEDAADIAIAIKKGFELSDACIIAELLPDRTNMGIMTVLRNLGVDWYVLESGSLNAVDLKTLKGVNDLTLYGNIKRLFSVLDMHNYSVVLNTNIAGETEASLQDSLARAIALEAGAIELRGGGELQEKGAAFCRAAGYEPLAAEKCVLALPQYRAMAEEAYSSCTEQIGIGCGAVTRLEGMCLRNTDDAQLYIAHVGEPDIIMQSV